MKIITTLITLALIFTSNAEASIIRKDMFENVREEVQSFYANSGEWSLVKVREIQEVHTDSREFILWSAKAQIQSVRTGRGKVETCLVTFIADNSDLYGINCF